MKPQFVLDLSCPDRPGIVHRVSGFLVAHSANILEAAQFDDLGTSRFFMRVQFEVNNVAFIAAGLSDSFAGVKALKVAGSDRVHRVGSCGEMACRASCAFERKQDRSV